MTNINPVAVESAISNKPMSPVQYRVVLLCSLLLVFDGYDIGAIGYAVPALAASWALSPSDFTLAIVLSGVGMLIGSLISGPLADWYGRKPVLIGCVVIFSVFSFASAFSETTLVLTITRFLTGLGLGGGVPTAIALTSDYLPRKNRAILAGVMTGAVPVGLVIGGLVSSKLIPAFGWQAIFLAGGLLPLLILPVLVIFLPESIQMMLARGKTAESISILKAMNIEPSSLTSGPTSGARSAVVGNPVLKLFQDGNATRTSLLWAMFLANFLSTWLIIFWLPTILSAAGANPGDAAFYSAMMPTGGLTGMIFIAVLARYASIEKILAAALLVGTVAVFSLWFWNSSTPVTAMLIILTGAGIMGAQFGMNGLSGAVYPSQIRSTGSGWAFGIGRFGNIIGPALGGLVLGLAFPPKTMFLVAVGPLLVATAAMVMLSHERSKGRLETEGNVVAMKQESRTSTAELASSN